MGCTVVREGLSAMLDGEPAPNADDLRAHVAGCPDCARWQAQSADLDRRLRIGLVRVGGPDVAETILSQVRLPSRGRWQNRLRVALAVVALVQVTIGLADLFDTMSLAMVVRSPHVDHEEAAFGVAFGVVMAMIAWNSRRARGEVPVLAAVVSMLAVSSVSDLANGEVSWPRLATHAPILAALILAVALGRATRGGDGPVGRVVPVPLPGGMAPAPPAVRREIA
ncbi:MAG TPA: hypothetical protein VFX16_27300 [Pseudonocardiaceae bacterium]|nr:hypothetical protein [Pseudonocardiaceae bacterium]